MAAESIGALYSTKIPGYADNADIQAAFKLYHYGSLDYDTSETDVAELINPSVAYTLNDLQEQITGLDPAGSVSKSTIDAKGDLLVGLSNDTVDNLAVGSNNFVLTADSSATLGVKWSALPTASTGGAGVVQLNDTYASTSTSLAPTANALKSVYDLSERKALTINTQSGTTYTLVAADADSKMVQFTSSSSVTVTVPASTFTAGQQINLTRYGSGSVTVQGAAGVTVNATPSLVLRAQYSAGTLVCIDASTFVLYGDLSTD
jgi:hypothetical protein